MKRGKDERDNGGKEEREGGKMEIKEGGRKALVKAFRLYSITLKSPYFLPGLSFGNLAIF